MSGVTSGMSTDVHTLAEQTTTFSSPSDLPSDLGLCHRMITELAAALQKTQTENAGLQQQLKSLLTRLYGPKSEKFDPNQPLLFADMQETAAEPAPAATIPSPEPDDQPKRLVQFLNRREMAAIWTSGGQRVLEAQRQPKLDMSGA